MKTEKRTNEEVEDNWNSLWKNILVQPDGSINVEQLKLELMDFSDMTERMSCLTDELTGGWLSYSTYPVATIMQVHAEKLQKALEDQHEDDMMDGVCSLCEREFE